MKKVILLSLSALTALTLAACSENGTATTSEESKVKEESVNKKETKTKEEVTAKVETTHTTGEAWLSYEGSEYVNIHSGAIYKNTGNTPVKIGESQMNHMAKDGSILGTETWIYSVPAVVMPGETAIVGETSYVDGIKVEDYAETNYNFSFRETDEEQNLMEVSGVKGILGTDSYKVTGLVKNITDKQQDDIRIAAALFDADGKLVGVLNGGVDVGVAPGGQAGFELNYPELPTDVLKTIETIEVKSYGWEF